jgi:PAS domain-containing protein
VSGLGPDDWVRGLDGLFVIPEPYREPRLDRAATLDTLRCGEAALDALITAGLPRTERAGQELFDQYDVFNLALTVRSGRSLPEIALGYSLRWMSGGESSWTESAFWSFSFELECPREQGCGAEPRWEQALPFFATGELAVDEGELLDLTVEPRGAEVDRQQGLVRHRGDGPLQVAGRIRTRGETRTLLSASARRIVDDYLALGHRWLRIPDPLQLDDALLAAAGVGPCISASRVLLRQFEEAGLRARTRRGWVLGILDLEHAWVEVLDEDGRWKPIDPVFVELARYAPDPHPALREACIGSKLNRLLPTSLPAEGRPSRHWCDGVESVPRTRTALRRLPGPPLEGGQPDDHAR